MHDMNFNRYQIEVLIAKTSRSLATCILLRFESVADLVIVPWNPPLVLRNADDGPSGTKQS